MKDRYQITYYARKKTDPVKPKKNRSYLDLTDRKTHEVKRFTFSKHLGEGSYGYVRLFTCGDEKIAVKALKDNEQKNADGKIEEELHHMSKAALTAWQNDLENEMALLKESYPDDTYYSLRHYHEREKDKNGYIYDCRMTMPFIPGMKLSEFAKNITDPEKMAHLMLRVTQELQRIHAEAGIIHGDAGGRNIMVTEEDGDYIVRFLDFGLAYRADGYAKVNFSKDAPSDTTSSDMAPERYANRRLKARPVQDVYSLAKTFWKLIKRRNDEWKEDFLSRYPVINQFINNGTLDWKERPELPDLIHDLECNLDWRAHLPKEFGSLIKALANEDFSKANQLLLKHPDIYTDEALTSLLYQLALTQESELVHELLAMKSSILLNTVINGNTCMHAAAMTGNLDIALTLLRHHPDLLMTNDDGDLAADVACGIVEPVIKLFTYIAKCEKNLERSGKSRLFDASHNKSCSHELAAARAIGHAILSGSRRGHSDIEEHFGVIKKSPKLREIYQRLQDENILNTAGNPIHGLINYVASYF